MKRNTRKFGLALIALTLLLSLVLMVSAIAPGTVYVDDALGNDVSGCGTGTGASACKTIQYAITNEAVAGDTVNVAAGTYTEDPNVDKALTLAGANQGINPVTGSRSAESIIQGQVTIASDNITLDGFTITNPTANNAIASAGWSNLTIKNNIVTNVGNDATSGNSHGIVITASAYASDITIEDNLFSHIYGGEAATCEAAAKSTNGSAKAIGICCRDSTFDVEDLLIQNNTIADVNASTCDWSEGGKGAYGILLGHGATGGGEAVNAQVLDNDISDLEGLWSTGVGLEGPTPGAVVTGNTIDDLTDHKSGGGTPDDDAAAIKFEDNPDAASVTLASNSFTNCEVGVRNVTGIGVDATSNWWGAADGPGSLGGGGATGAGVGVWTDVDYSPWWGANYVGDDHSSAWTWYTNDSIQDAIDAASSGDTINVAAGTYVEQVVINKDLTLQGSGNPVIKAPSSPAAFKFPESSKWWEPVVFAFGGTADLAGEISGAGQVTVNISGFVVDGNDRAPTSGRRSAGILLRNVVSTSSISGNTVQNMYIDSAETFGIIAYGDSNVTISGNTISGYARGGIGVNGDSDGINPPPHPAPHAVIENNTVTGPGMEVPVTWAPNGIQIGWGATGEIRNNTVSGNGWPGTDWTGSGILVFLSDNVPVKENTVTSNETGICVAGYMWDPAGGTASGTEIRDNRVQDNEYGISVQDKSVDTVIEGNTITGSTYDGIDVCNFYGNPPTGTEIHYNDIYGNNTASDSSSGGLWVDTGVATVDAENNWWGDASGPEDLLGADEAEPSTCYDPSTMKNADGTGDSVSDLNVDYCPWLDSSPLEAVWNRYAGNPVVIGSDALDPVVVKDGSTYRMWYAHIDGGWSIYYADSTNGTTWTNQIPVLTGAGSGWDEELRGGPAVIKDSTGCLVVSGCQWKMWYTGRDSAGGNQIGYAETTDTEGDAGWTRYGSNPVLIPGTLSTDWDNQLVRGPWVIKDGGTYKMWYAGTQQWPYFRIGYVESTDGVTWTTNRQQVTGLGGAGAWDEAEQYGASVVKMGSTYYLYYSGTDGGPGRPSSYRWSTGTATSSNGTAWTKDSHNPILIPAPTEPDSLDFVSAMYDSGWKVWFSYVPAGSYAIGLATLGAPTMELYLDPVSQGVLRDGSSTVTYDIRLANASGVYGYNFELTFDAAYVQATSAVTVTTFFDCQATNPAWNGAIDNGAGTVRFACSRTAPLQGPVYGSGPLAQVTFMAKVGGSLGTSVLDFSSDTQKLKLVDRDGFRLTTETQHGFIKTWGAGSLSGSVTLQGRTDHSGATVTIQNDSGYVDTTTTNAAGAWSFTAVPADTNYQVNVDMNRYLDAQKGDLNTYTNLVTVSDGGSTALSNVKLLGGDIVAPPEDGDDLVDISDIAVIGFAYDPLTVIVPANTKEDINYDTYVDISDFVIAAGNYTSASPVPWP